MAEIKSRTTIDAWMFEAARQIAHQQQSYDRGSFPLSTVTIAQIIADVMGESSHTPAQPRAVPRARTKG